MRNVKLHKSFALLLAGLVCLLMILPLRTLVAEYRSGRVASILDDPATEGRDVVALSEETLPVYEQALAALGRAAALDPTNSRHHKALSEVYLKLGTWSEAMEQMGRPPSRNSSLDLNKALGEAQRAVSLEPTNPDCHLALGAIADLLGKGPDASGREYELAASLFPHNAPLRYSVAMRYLLTARKEKALEHAKKLASIDDSYSLSDSIRGTLVRERRSSGYYAFLSQSYLYKSYEIAWRSVGQDTGVIDKMTPEAPEARDTLELFYENKGMDAVPAQVPQQ